MKLAVTVCPECDHPDIAHRGSAATKTEKYRCGKCQSRFPEPVKREPRRSNIAERIKAGEVEI